MANKDGSFDPTINGDAMDDVYRSLSGNSLFQIVRLLLFRKFQGKEEDILITYNSMGLRSAIITGI